jgi:hypothetical protein
MQFACRVTVFLLRGPPCDGAGLADQELIADFGPSALQEFCSGHKYFMNHGCARGAMPAPRGGRAAQWMQMDANVIL